jgi:glycerol-3-phosphate acyltransferase PlsY
MATMIGVFAMLYPQQIWLAAIVFLATLALTRNWNASCIVGFVWFVMTIWLAGQLPKRFLYPLLLLPAIGLWKIWQQWRTKHQVA